MNNEMRTLNSFNDFSVSNITTKTKQHRKMLFFKGKRGADRIGSRRTAFGRVACFDRLTTTTMRELFLSQKQRRTLKSFDALIRYRALSLSACCSASAIIRCRTRNQLLCTRIEKSVGLWYFNISLCTTTHKQCEGIETQANTRTINCAPLKPPDD